MLTQKEAPGSMGTMLIIYNLYDTSFLKRILGD